MTTSLVRTRYGTVEDLTQVTELHDRCSPGALLRRYHAPIPHLHERLARELLAPELGWSVLAELGDMVVAIASVGPLSPHDVEIGVLVEDAHQGRGIGGRLLREVATEAAGRGYRSLLCLTQPDNDPVLATVRRAGLPRACATSDGVLTVTMRLAAPGVALPHPA